jgi:hypothetical protein
VASPDGLGPALVGQPAPEFAAALGRTLAPLEDSGAQGCYQRKVVGLDGVLLMTIEAADGPVRRVDILVRGIRTAAGVGIGSSEAAVRSAYPGRVVEAPHKYVAGAKYLTVSSGGHVLLFETDEKGVVTTFRFGDPDPTSWVEGCA